MIVLKNTLSIQGVLIIGMHGGTLRRIINKHGFFSKTLDITWNILEVCNRYNIIMVSLCGTNHGFDHGQYWNEIYAKMTKAMLWAWTLAINVAYIRLTKTCPLYPKFFFTTSILDESPMARITTMVDSVNLKLINYW